VRVRVRRRVDDDTSSSSEGACVASIGQQCVVWVRACVHVVVVWVYVRGVTGTMGVRYDLAIAEPEVRNNGVDV
jgi:hypothetical protein